MSTLILEFTARKKSKMRTSRYGEITEYQSFAFERIKTTVKLVQKDVWICDCCKAMKGLPKERWICHAFQSLPKGNGNWGSEVVVFVDNYGECYHFRESGVGNGYGKSEIVHFTPTYDKYGMMEPINTQENTGAYGQYIGKEIRCTPKEEAEFAFTDDFIDILKLSVNPNPDGDLPKKIGDPSTSTRKRVEMFVKKLLETNKKYFEMVDEENSTVQEEETNTYSERSQDEDRSLHLSAAEKRLQDAKRRGFTSDKAADKFHREMAKKREPSPEERETQERERLARISHSWAYDS